MFLDTSIHCCFHKGETLGPRLNWLLGLFSWKGSSTYSQVEYGNVILATAQYCLRKLRELKSVAGLLEHINHVLPPQHHKYKTWAFSLIQTLGRTEEERMRRTDASLRRLLKFGTSAVAAHCDDACQRDEVPLGEDRAPAQARRGIRLEDSELQVIQQGVQRGRFLR